MDEVKYDVHKLEEFAQFIKESRAEMRERYLFSSSIPFASYDEDSSTVHMSDITESDIEPSPTHRPARRRLQSQQAKRSTVADLGTRHRPIMLVQGSDDERSIEIQDRKNVSGPTTPIRRGHQGHVSFCFRLPMPSNAHIDDRRGAPVDSNICPNGIQFAKDKEGRLAPHTSCMNSCNSSNGCKSERLMKKRTRGMEGLHEGRAQKSQKCDTSSV